MGIDLLMMFTKGSKAISGEGQSVIDPDDDLMSGFTAGNFFEIEDFSLGLKVSDMESSKSTPPPKSTQGAHGATDDDSSRGRQGAFSGWVRGITPKPLSATDPRIYPVAFDEFAVTRRIDKASLKILEGCFGTEAYDSAAIVKRKLTGIEDGPTNHVPYLRLDFASVLITSVDWDVSDDVIKEKVRFVCRGTRVLYRPQNADGSLGKEMHTKQLSLVQAK